TLHNLSESDKPYILKAHLQAKFYIPYFFINCQPLILKQKKKNMNIKKTIILALCLSAHMASAQADFRPGYVIKAPGDTLYGEIDYRGDLLMGSVCRFRNEHKETKDYTPHDIFAFRFY